MFWLRNEIKSKLLSGGLADVIAIGRLRTMIQFVSFAFIEVYGPSQLYFSHIALPLKLWDLYSTNNT